MIGLTPLILTIIAIGLSGCAPLEKPGTSQFALTHGGTYIDPDRFSDFAALSTKIPINKRYSELTPEERAPLLAFYEPIPTEDEPPFPEDGLQPVIDALVQAQDRLQAKGRLSLVATVGADGRVESVTSYGSPSKAMTQFASSVLLLTKFKPAICSGRPCKMQFPFHVRFSSS